MAVLSHEDKTGNLFPCVWFDGNAEEAAEFLHGRGQSIWVSSQSWGSCPLTLKFCGPGGSGLARIETLETGLYRSVTG